MSDVSRDCAWTRERCQGALMELMKVSGRRRTIRSFQPFRPVEREKIQKMLERLGTPRAQTT